MKGFAINRKGFVFHENRQKLCLRQIIAGFSKFRDLSLEFTFAMVLSGFCYLYFFEQKWTKIPESRSHSYGEKKKNSDHDWRRVKKPWKLGSHLSVLLLKQWSFLRKKHEFLHYLNLKLFSNFPMFSRRPSWIDSTQLTFKIFRSTS